MDTIPTPHKENLAVFIGYLWQKSHTHCAFVKKFTHKTIKLRLLLYLTLNKIFCHFDRDPTKGNSKVPTPWLNYNTQYGMYLEINKKITSKSMKQDLRSPYVKFWCTTYRNLPNA